MDISYFQKVNNTYGSKNKQETDLYLLNRHVDECFSDTIDYHIVKRNGIPFELLIIKDTDGNTFKKKIKSKHASPFNLGDYIEWNNQIWIVTLLDPDEKAYHSGYMYLCTTPIRWQNTDGEIIERWAYAEDFTKYSNGTIGNSTITVGDNQYGLTLPLDSETRKLKRDLRFAIDADDAVVPDVYMLTNRKVRLNNNEYFGRGGTMVVTASFNAFNPEKDKHITLEDGTQVWICDYHSPITPPSPPIESTDLSANISGGTTIRCGRAKTWTAAFKNKDGNEVIDCDFHWNIVSDFTIHQVDDGNKIQLKVIDENSIGCSFLLQLIHDDNILSECEITVIEGF